MPVFTIFPLCSEGGLVFWWDEGMSGSLASNEVVHALDLYLKHNPDVAWYRVEGIPSTKLKNAIRKYAKGVSPGSVLALADGTVFGSAKEGLLLTADRMYVKTVEEAFSLRLSKITGARAVSGWPNYTIEVDSSDQLTYRIATICFDQQQANLVQFFNALAEINSVSLTSEPEFPSEVNTTPPAPPVEEPPSSVPFASPSAVDRRSVQSVNSGLRLITVCPHAEIQDTDKLFQTALQASEEWPLVKGFCKYVGFNQREVEGLFLLTNRRLLLFSSESGMKIFLVEMTMRFLDKVPFPFFDSIVGFFLFKIPRSIYVALRGGKEKMIVRTLGIDNSQLMSSKPPVRKVQDFSYQQLADTVDRVEIGSGIWTGILSRAFGVSFAPNGLTKTFSIPKDLILPEYETLEPFADLLTAINSTLEQRGLKVVVEDEGQKLSLIRNEQVENKAA